MPCTYKIVGKFCGMSISYFKIIYMAREDCLTTNLFFQTPILHSHLQNLAHGQFSSLPEDGGKGFQETPHQALSTWCHR